MSTTINQTQNDRNQSAPKKTPPICVSCQSKPMRYTCPKCNSPYCSRDCYASHSAQCAESFYRESVEADLKSKRPTLEEQQAMKAILEREKQAQSSDASHIESLAQTGASVPDVMDDDELLELAALDLDDPNWMSQLSASTFSKFHQVISSGALEDVLHPWIPWWYRDTLTPKIMIMEPETSEEGQNDENDENEENSLEPAPSPPLLSPIPSIRSLTTVTPSFLLANNAVELLYAYTYTKRMFNGDWDEENCLDAVEMVIVLSAVLRENAVYKDLKDACRTPIEVSIKNFETCVSPAFSNSILDDVRKIISHGPQFLTAAFSELHELFLTATRLNSENPPPRTKPKVTLSQMQKKLLFMVAWSNECCETLIPALEAGIQLTISELPVQASTTSSESTNPSVLQMTSPTKPSPPTGPKIEVLT